MSDIARTFSPQRLPGARWVAGLLSAAALLVALALVPLAQAACPNEAIREAQGATYLPDCMALEQVTPPVKFNRLAGTFGQAPSISKSGDRISFESAAALGETESQGSPVGDLYLASRGAGGWSTEATAPPASYGYGYGGTTNPGYALSLTPELDRWLSLQGTTRQAQNGEMTVYEAALGGAWTPRSPLLAPLDGHHGLQVGKEVAWDLLGASAEFDHVFVRAADAYAQDSNGVKAENGYSTAFLPGDPQPRLAAGRPEATWNTYALSRGPLGEARIALMARDAADKAWGGNCGAFLGGGGLEGQLGGRNQGAVSADGSLAYFSTRPAQPQLDSENPTYPRCVAEASLGAIEQGEAKIEAVETAGGEGGAAPLVAGEEIFTSATCGGEPCFAPGTTITAVSGSTIEVSPPPLEDGAAGKTVNAVPPLRIMQREESASGEATISELLPAAPAAGSDYFEGASEDQKRVYFTSPRKLAASDEDPAGGECAGTNSEATLIFPSSVGCDLYLDEALPGGGHQIVQVSAGDATDPTPGEGADVFKGVTAISADGSHVYFAAQGVLTTHPNPEGAVAEAGKLNLYAYQRDAAHPAGELAFVGELDSGCTKVGGGSPDCNSLVAGPISYWNDAAALPMEGDGSTLVFESTAPLTANDADNHRIDIFRYRADTTPPTLRCVSCKPGGGADSGEFDVATRTGATTQNPGLEFAQHQRWASEDGESIVFATAEALLPEDVDGVRSDYLWREGALTLLPGGGEKPAISQDGSEVAFETAAPLLPTDGDSATDVYLARADGGFPTAPETVACSGEGCQGPAGAAPAAPSPASESITGKGDAKPVAPRGNCKAPARGAQKLSRRAKNLRRNASRVNRRNHRRAALLRRRARRLATRARKQSRSAKRCRVRARKNRRAHR